MQETATAAPVYEGPDDDAREYYSNHGKKGVLQPGDYTDPAALLKHAYGDCYQEIGSIDPYDGADRALLAHTSFLPPSEAAEVAGIGMPDRYNHFDREAVVETLRRLPGRARVVLGRESSPVVYVWVPDGDHAVVEAALDGEHMDAFTEGYERRDGSTGHTTVRPRPDEYSAIRPGEATRYFAVNDGTLVRMWWD